jgi:rhamnogalacturonan endolyase
MTKPHLLLQLFAAPLRVGLLVALVVVAASAVSVSRAAAAEPAGAAADRVPANSPVKISETDDQFTLENGIVTARINKRNGDLESLVFRGIDTMGHDQGRAGYWEQDPSQAPDLTQSVTIDPTKNGGGRGEVSIRGVTGGKVKLTPNAPGGGTYCDIEVRYSLGRGDSGIYVYGVFSHPASYPAGGVGPESRYITKISQIFDWVTVDADRNLLECAPTDWGTGVVVHAKEQRLLTKGVYKNSVEHKYSYSGVQYRTPAYGWSSTQQRIGIWFINPTIEYLSGGPTKQDLDCHFGDNENPDPIILDYWVGGHYDTGARVNVAAGQAWSKVVGPIFVYVNSLDHPQPTSQSELDTLAATAGNPSVPASWQHNATALWQDALAQAKRESAKWPYAWVEGVDYPHAEQRGAVTGRITLHDRLAPNPAATKLPHLVVGLTHPETNGVAWIHDATYYQFWNDGEEDGAFTIAKVRPGTYTLRAFADGVLGEFEQANITVEAGKSVDLGQLEWKPVRYGRQLWEIGYPDQTGGKFFKGDGANYWLWGWNLRYALLFPNDVTYTIGQSDYHKDWFFEMVPHATNLSFVNPEAKDPANQRFGWVKGESLEQYPQTNTRGPWAIYGSGRATVWRIKFSAEKPAQGYAALRVALAGVNGLSQLSVSLNGQSIGAIGDGRSPDNARLITTNTIRYNSDRGLWQHRTLRFDAALLRAGENEMTFTMPGGDLQNGVVWDYLRLELNETQKLDGTPVAAN